MPNSSTTPSAKIKPISTLPYWARMTSWLLALLTFNFAFLISACGLDVEDPTPPSPPVWVQKSLPDEWPERGIDAHESGGIYLEWEPNHEDNISAYLVFIAQYYDDKDSLGSYDLVQRCESLIAGDLNFLHADASHNTKYFYKLKAEDSAENQSEFSDSIFYSLLPRLPDDGLVPNGNTAILKSTRNLSWFYDYYIEMENYCLTILSQNNDLILRTIIIPTDYVRRSETWIIPETVDLNSNQIYKWRIDIGAQYIQKKETLGSESAWATFLYANEEE